MMIYLPTAKVDGGIINISQISYISDVTKKPNNGMYWYMIALGDIEYSCTFSDIAAAEGEHRRLIEVLNGERSPLTGKTFAEMSAGAPPPPPDQMFTMIGTPNEDKASALGWFILSAVLSAIVLFGAFKAFFS